MVELDLREADICPTCGSARACEHDERPIWHNMGFTDEDAYQRWQAEQKDFDEWRAEEQRKEQAEITAKSQPMNRTQAIALKKLMASWHEEMYGVKIQPLPDGHYAVAHTEYDEVFKNQWAYECWLRSQAD